MGPPALLMLGIREDKWGPVALPFDLTPLGAPGCRIWTAPIMQMGAPVTPSGTAQIKLGIPVDPAINGARLNAGGLNMDSKANSLGMTTSSYARIIIGI